MNQQRNDRAALKQEAGECIVPGEPIPPEEVARYSPSRDPHRERDIADYVHSQARDETVKHVERVKTEYVMGDRYEVWDVISDKGRWWVVTDPANLYSQAHFQSLDYTLSFHVGLMMRVRSRQLLRPDASPFDEVARRQQQARDRFDRAVEAEDYQAVGMQLREGLLSLVTAVRRRLDVGTVPDPPKAADFVGWSNVLLDVLCGGGSNKALRQYMKSASERSWQLVSSLTHDRDAAKTVASVSLQACDTLVSQFIELLMRRETDDLAVCPSCASRDLRSHFDADLEPDGQYYLTCGSCSWTDHPKRV